MTVHTNCFVFLLSFCFRSNTGRISFSSSSFVNSIISFSICLDGLVSSPIDPFCILSHYGQHTKTIHLKDKDGNKKAMMDENSVFLPADRGRIMVTMDKWESEGKEESYEYKMKKVLTDSKAKPFIKLGLDPKSVSRRIKDHTEYYKKKLVSRGY